MAETALEAVLRRDRAVVRASLVALTALAWSYLLWLAADMRMGGMSMSGARMVPAGIGWMVPAGTPWGGAELLLVFLMWAVMMIGMMTPTAAPMLLIYARVARQAAVGHGPFAATRWFAGGYLLIWTAFSLVATLVQWALERAMLLSPAMTVGSREIGAAVLIGAGVYQWTGAKRACLRHCQASIAFIQRHGGIRRDSWGALRLGMQHGVYCVGCCWTLMALLFVGGVMNVLWIAALSILVLLEKVLPRGVLVARIAGIGLAAAGIGWLLAAR